MPFGVDREPVGEGVQGGGYAHRTSKWAILTTRLS